MNNIFEYLSADIAQAFAHLSAEELYDLAVFNGACQIRALEATLTGCPNKSAMSGGLKVCAMVGDIPEHLLSQRAALGFSQLYIILDPTNPVGPPARFDFLYIEGARASFFKDCVLWAPKVGRRMMIIPDATERGFFSFKPGRALSYQDMDLAESIEVGLERAMDRFADCMVSLTTADLGRFGLTPA